MAILQRYIKVGALTSDELHTEQVLESLTKFVSNYGWCIEEIAATPSVLEPLFSIQMPELDEVLDINV